MFRGGILCASKVPGRGLVRGQGNGKDDWAGRVVQNLSIVLAQANKSSLPVVVDIVEISDMLGVIDISDDICGSGIDTEGTNCEDGLQNAIDERNGHEYACQSRDGDSLPSDS